MKMKNYDLCEKIASRLALRISRKAATVAFLCFVTSLYLMFTLINNRFLHYLPWYKHPAPCVTPKFILDEMVQLTFTVSSLLTRLNISHTLCYGTLWGALRYGKTLPWDNNVDFCVLKDEVQKVSWTTLYNNFKSNHMDVVYDPRQGEYIIHSGPAQAVLNVFYKTQLGKAQKDGFDHRYLWFLQSSPVAFPSRLIEGPFNEIVFHGRPLPVPRDDMDILKYLYKDSWWVEEPPAGCPLDLVLAILQGGAVLVMALSFSSTPIFYILFQDSVSCY